MLDAYGSHSHDVASLWKNPCYTRKSSGGLATQAERSFYTKEGKEKNLKVHLSLTALASGRDGLWLVP